MKGVSDKDAQNDKRIKGSKNDARKPLQVLHISKKDNTTGKEKFFDDNLKLSKEKESERTVIKPQIIKDLSLIHI